MPVVQQIGIFTDMSNLHSTGYLKSVDSISKSYIYLKKYKIHSQNNQVLINLLTKYFFIRFYIAAQQSEF